MARMWCGDRIQHPPGSRRRVLLTSVANQRPVAFVNVLQLTVNLGDVHIRAAITEQVVELFRFLFIHHVQFTAGLQLRTLPSNSDSLALESSSLTSVTSVCG